jgi:hypothetical protein
VIEPLLPYEVKNGCLVQHHVKRNTRCFKGDNHYVRGYGCLCLYFCIYIPLIWVLHVGLPLHNSFEFRTEMLFTLYDEAVYIFGLCFLMVFIFSFGRLVCHCRLEFSKAHLTSSDSKPSHSFMPQ